MPDNFTKNLSPLNHISVDQSNSKTFRLVDKIWEKDQLNDIEINNENHMPVANESQFIEWVESWYSEDIEESDSDISSIQTSN